MTAPGTEPKPYDSGITIGVDVGGTHTDVCAIAGSRIERGKSFTTYDDFSTGVLNALEVVAENFGMSRQQLLGQTALFVNGTTVVTNTITELNGCRVGVLITEGFKDTFRIAGGPRAAEFDNHKQHNAPDIVRKTDIMEVEERIDWRGNALVSLNQEALRGLVRRLVDVNKVESIAVCFMSSYINPAHELLAQRLINEMYPTLFVSLSHKLFPVVGETRRWTTTVLNSFVQLTARRYLESLSSKLSEAGLRRGLVFFQGLGGGISLERAKEFPLALLGSGPAGGAIGANALARQMGYTHVLIGDMGGTSFDTGIIVDNEIHLEKNLKIGLLQTGVNIVDVMSIGAGGGSIAWVGERGIPQVGPQSATSSPGPAAYGKGGKQPTVTDAMVVLGFIDPERYLGGRFTLRKDLAAHALKDDIADRFGWSVEEAAAVIHDLVVVNMASAVHEVSVAKGHDPRDFVFLAYGGTLPMFALQIAEHMNMKEVVIPANSSVFCAMGLLSSDFVMRFSKTVTWDLDADGALRVNAIADQLLEQATGTMKAEGFADAAISIQCLGDFRFRGQAYELTIPLPNGQLSGAIAADLSAQFTALYERTYGAGTAWKGVPIEMVNYTVAVTGLQPRPELRTSRMQVKSDQEILIGHRRVFLPSSRTFEEIGVYDDARFTPGSSVRGPAIIDASDTTIFVPPKARARRDQYLNYILTVEE